MFGKGGGGEGGDYILFFGSGLDLKLWEDI